jgi:hypothetical protein
VNTVEWGVEVTLVELKDIQLPDSMKRAMAKQAEAEREKRAKIINAEGESLAAAALGDASDTMMAHPLALQLRNLQSLVEIGVDKNTTVVFPAPLMTTIAELGAFLAREKAAAGPVAPVPPVIATRAPLDAAAERHARGRAERHTRGRLSRGPRLRSGDGADHRQRPTDDPGKYGEGLARGMGGRILKSTECQLRGFPMSCPDLAGLENRRADAVRCR